MKYLITDVGSTDSDDFDGGALYYVLPLSQNNIHDITLGHETYKKLSKISQFQHLVFNGVGYFIEYDSLTEDEFDNEKFDALLETEVKQEGTLSIWLSDNDEDIQEFIKQFGVEAEAMSIYENSVIMKYTPNHFDGYVTSTEITLEAIKNAISNDQRVDNR